LTKGKSHSQKRSWVIDRKTVEQGFGSPLPFVIMVEG
jgi:hypothetical protein